MCRGRPRPLDRSKNGRKKAKGVLEKMFKVTETGIELGEVIELTEEDRKVIQEMFDVYQYSEYLDKDEGVWKKPDSLRGDRT